MCLRLNWARRPLDPVTECTGSDKDLLGASCRRRSSTAVTAIAVVGTVMRWQWCVVVDVCIIQYRMWRSPAEERLEVSAHGAGEAVMIHGPMGR